MRVLVTGAAGFIGSHTCETILKDKRIKKLVGVDHLKDGSLRNLKNIIKNRKFHFKKIDIRDRRLFPKLFKKIDVIIHLAAVSDIVPSIKYPSEYLDVNFNGTLNILENMRRFSVKKIIFSASSSCYGIPKNFPTSEKEKITKEQLQKRIDEDRQDDKREAASQIMGKVYGLTDPEASRLTKEREDPFFINPSC